jgi:hypothetical protein
MEQQELAKAIEDMAVTLADSWDALSHLTCNEADTIVEVVALAGHTELAAQIVVCHARGETSGEGDQEGDRHEDVALAHWGKDRNHMSLARAYVARLIGEE